MFIRVPIKNRAGIALTWVAVVALLALFFAGAVLAAGSPRSCGLEPVHQKVSDAAAAIRRSPLLSRTAGHFEAAAAAAPALHKQLTAACEAWLKPGTPQSKAPDASKLPAFDFAPDRAECGLQAPLASLQQVRDGILQSPVYGNGGGNLAPGLAELARMVRELHAGCAALQSVSTPAREPSRSRP